MKISSFKRTFILGVVAVLVSACSSGAPTTLPTRVATQTPWIIERVITATPEPLVVTPLPTSAILKTPTRGATAKPIVAPTKPPVASPVAAASATSVPPSCSVGAVTLLFPENPAPRTTRANGSGGNAFIMKWTPFQNGESDPAFGYKIVFDSRRGGKTVNGATVYVSHNKFLRDGQQYVYDQRAVSGLAAGDDASVNWTVTVVKASGGIDDQGNASGTIVNCSPASPPNVIQLHVIE